MAYIEGTEIADVLYGVPGETNTILGLGGDDIIYGSDTQDPIPFPTFGGYDHGIGGDYIVGGAGNDIIFGGGGNDYILGDGATFSLDSGNDELHGGDGNDYLRGRYGVDFYDGGSGNDRVSFFSLDATSAVHASLMTGIVLDDGYGNAEIMVSIESLGQGTIFADFFEGSNGDNLFLADTGDTVLMHDGDDGVQLGGAAALIDGGAGIDSITQILASTWVADSDGDGFADEISTTAGAYVDLRNGTMSDGFGNFGTLISIENVGGSENGDTILGSDGNNVLEGFAGDDYIYGWDGDDEIHGGDGDDYLAGEGSSAGGGFGNDALYGEAGDDYLRGGAGVDTYDGGDGNDRISFFNLHATEAVVASLLTGIITNDGFGNAEVMISIENLGQGTAFADTFEGDDNGTLFLGDVGDIITMLGGDDEIQLSGAPALLNGGAGTDTILGFVDFTVIPDTDGDGFAELVDRTEGVVVNLKKGEITDDGFGNKGDLVSIENVTGSAFDDILIGGNGDNVLTGGLGADELNGGKGNDTFAYTSEQDSLVGSSDTIIKFDSTDDMIDLSGLAGDVVTGDPLVVVSAFSGTAGEIVLTAGRGHRAELDIDLDGDGTSDFHIDFLRSDVPDATNLIV